jgi:hypothetical protein
MLPDERQWEIGELIHRRTDLSTFVIHWTRDLEGTPAQENLASMLQGGKILARNPMGAAVKALQEQPESEERETALASQKVVCFTEAPLEQAWSFVSYIQGRQVQLKPYGLAFTKRRARRLGINPVWYVDMTPGHDHDWLIRDVWSLVEQAIESGLSTFRKHPIARIAPFVEGMGTWSDDPRDRKEFWWEREWRHTGDLTFSLEEAAVIFCPEEDMAAFEKIASPGRVPSPGELARHVPLIDPRWGLEHIIATLAGVPEDDIDSV